MRSKIGPVVTLKRFGRLVVWVALCVGIITLCIGRWWPGLVDSEATVPRAIVYLAWISVSWSLGSAAAFTAVGTLALLVRAWTPGAIALATAGTRIDYVWTNSGLECVEAHVGDQSGSDHRPLIATLRAAR